MYCCKVLTLYMKRCDNNLKVDCDELKNYTVNLKETTTKETERKVKQK